MIVKIEIEIKDELANFIKPIDIYAEMPHKFIARELIKYADSVTVV